MPRGGKRSGAGRPVGTTKVVPRSNHRLFPSTTKQLENVDMFKANFFKKIKPFMESDMSKMYQNMMDEGDMKPLEMMKTILKDLMIRYKMGRVQELNASRTWESITKFVDTIRQLAESISNIEKENPTTEINILNILILEGHKKSAEELTKKIFTIEDFDVLEPIQYVGNTATIGVSGTIGGTSVKV